jgi:hypothetical protein
MVEVEEDFLSVDPKIPGQNFACISFVSPEKILKDKDRFKLESFCNHISKKFGLDGTKIIEEYDSFIQTNENKIEEEFHDKVDFSTSVRGIKIRGTYDTQREATIRAKVLQRRDKNFHVFVGQVGYWLPWDPNPEDMENQEYQKDHLNTLVKKYKENQQSKEDYYEDDKENKIKKARDDANINKAIIEKEYQENEAKKRRIRERNIDISDDCIKAFELDPGKQYSRGELLQFATNYLKKVDCLHDNSITVNKMISDLFSISENSIIKENELEAYLEKHVTEKQKADDTNADDTNADDTNADDIKADDTNADDTTADDINADDINVEQSSSNNIFSEEDPWATRKTELSK